MGRTALAGNVTLAWDANTETDLAGYKVHYGTSSRTYTQVIDVGNVTTYTVTALATGTYYFAVTAYNTSRAESDYSNEVSTPVGTCTYSLSSNSQSMTARSSAGSVSVIAAPGCAWSASSNASWITITSGSSGNGNGTVTYTVSSNTTPAPRSGTLTVAGQTFIVAQARTGCDINQDAAVNVVDIQVLMNIILGASTCDGYCNVNGDTRVDVADLQTLQNVILGLRVCP